MKSIREDLLARCSTALGVAFGQHEELTNRLQRILTGYPRDTTILKELLQNADDAGATEIHFILDPRQHGTGSIFEDKWQPLQGPGLLVYNNKPFTEADMEGIQKLGKGSKSDDPTKTGQYGIGFNCVYHLTDVPMFITKGKEVGNTMCILDPNCTYVPGATEKSPGRRLEDLETLRKQFPDVFKCFLEDQITLEEATIFRFPLRNEDMAQKSTLLKDPISVEDVQSLLNTFTDHLSECLLFLNNIQNVTISKIDEASNNMLKVYQASANLNAKDKLERKVFSEKVAHAAQELKNGSRDISNVPCHVAIYSMSIEDNRGLHKEYRIGQQIGFDRSEVETTSTVIEGYRNGELGLLPRGGVAFSRESRNKMYPKKETISSQFFCFLPLPVEVHLPKGVHINGHFALDYESRHTLWRKENGGMKADWNAEMMQKIVGPLYAQLLEDNTKKIDRKLAERKHLRTIQFEVAEHARLFPTSNTRRQKHIYIDILHDALYQCISWKGLEVLPVIRPTKNDIEWHPADGDVFFNNLMTCPTLERPQKTSAFCTPTKIIAPYEIVESVLLESSFNLLNLPMTVHSSFSDASVEMKKVNPEDVINFFCTHVMKADLPKPLKDTPFETIPRLQHVVEYCKLAKSFFSKLLELPFVVTCDLKLRTIDEFQGVYLTHYHTLISNQKHRFLHEELITFFTSCNKEENIAFKELTVQDLVSMLKFDPRCTFMGRNEEVDYSVNQIGWLRGVWHFLKKEADKVKVDRWFRPISDPERAKLNKLLEPLAEWSIFPVRRNSRTCLIPLREVQSVIDLSMGDCGSEKVRNAIREIKLPEPDYFVLSQQYEPIESSPIYLAMALVASINNPVGVLTCLRHQLAKSSTLEGLSNVNAGYLLRYFAENIDKVRDFDTIDTLKRLPYYETVKHKLVSLENTHVYIILHELPTADLDCFEHTGRGNVFLKSNVTLKDLFRYIGGIHMTEVEVYCTFILLQEHFEMMSEEGRKVHLDYILKKLLPKLESERGKSDASGALIEKLMTLQFIPDSNGQLLKACKFHDPTNEVLLAMEDAKFFPPQPFREYHWLKFLRKIGLVHEVTPDMFLKYANTVAVGATHNPSNKKTLEQSRLLVELLVHELDNRKPEWQDRNFVCEVSKILFIAPHRVDTRLCNLHPQYGFRTIDGQLRFARYRDSVICGKAVDKLTWSSSMLIPSSAEPRGDKKKDLMQLMGVTKIPSQKAVLEHLESLCKYQDQRKESTCKDSTGTRGLLLITVLKVIYEFLKNQNCYETAREKLQDVKFVPVEKGSKLVFAKQVAIEILAKDEIRPYFYKLPLDIGEYRDVLKNLGVNEEPTAEQYAQVLKEIHMKTEDKEMIPWEGQKALRAFACLVDKVEETRNALNNCVHLLLPTTNNRMLPSDELIFYDGTSQKGRLYKFAQPFVCDGWSIPGDMKELKDKISTERLSNFFKSLPEHLKCHFLKDVVEEVMEDQAIVEDKAEVDVIRDVASKLRDPRFSRAVLRLLRHQQIMEGGIMSSQDENQVQAEIRDGLEQLKILSVGSEIRTYLQYQGERIEGSEKRGCGVL